MSWQNRIVGHGEEDPEQLLANPKNWRIHPQEQQDALLQVLDKVGWVSDVIVNRATGNIVDGHLRVSLALRRNEPTIPVKYVELSEEEEDLILATIDPIAAMAATDKEKLEELLIEIDDKDVLGVVEAVAELEQVALESAAAAAGVDAEDPGVDLDDAEKLQLKWQVQPGDIWEIEGGHILACGDASELSTYQRIFANDGTPVEMIFTDPPYGVSIGDKNVWLGQVGKAHHKRVKENIANDTLDQGALEELLRDAFTTVLAYQKPGGAWYVTAPLGPVGLAFSVVLNELGVWRQMLIWEKNVATFAPMGVDYHWKTEGIYYGWKPGGAHRFYGGRQQDNVWEIAKEQKSPLHPTMKPLELVEKALENSSKPGDVVLDPFVGSGTTVVAAARMGRVGIGIDLDPKYIAASLERVTGLGLKAKRRDG